MNNEDLKRILLLMKYDTKNTLTENNNLISETYNYVNKSILNEQGLFRAIFGSSDDLLRAGSAAERAAIRSSDNLLAKAGQLRTTSGKVIKTGDELFNALKNGKLATTSVGKLRISVINTGSAKARNSLMKTLTNDTQVIKSASGKSKTTISAEYQALGYTKQTADEIAETLYKKTSTGKTGANVSKVDDEYKRLIDDWKKQQKAAGKTNLKPGEGTRNRLYKQAQDNISKGKGGKGGKGGNKNKKRNDPPENPDPTKLTKWQNFKQKAAAAGVKLWANKGVRWFLIGVGGALGLYLAYKFMTSKGSSPFPGCITGMARAEDLENYAAGTEDKLSIGETGNSDLDLLGGGIFYDDGGFTTGNGKYKGQWVIDGEIIYVTVNSNAYQIACAGTGDNSDEGGGGGTGGGGTGDDEEESSETEEDVSTEDGDENDPTVYADCKDTYKLGCTDVFGNIKEVQACLGLPTNGKFGPIMEKKLKEKTGKTTFTPADIWVICGKKAGDTYIF
jgi:hypothetical protein